MNTFLEKEIRNICLIGHNKAGKTSLAESFIYNTGVLSRLGKVEDGNTVCDYDSEEAKRGLSIRTSAASIEWSNHKINLLDTPGYFDFIGDMLCAVQAADSAIVVVSGKSGLGVSGEIAVEHAKEKELPLLFFINKMDHENAHFKEIVDSLRNQYGTGVVPIMIPIKHGADFIGYIDVADSKAYEFTSDGKKKEIPVPDEYYAQLQETKAELCEAIAEADDTLLEKFFSDQPFTKEDMKRGIEEAVLSRTLFPVTCGSAVKNLAIDALANMALAYLPSPAQKGLAGDKDAPLQAQVFKTIIDPFVGKLTLVKILSGTLKANSSVYNVNKDGLEKIGNVMALLGKDKTDLPFLSAGDIGAVAKLTLTQTGDTLSVPENKTALPAMEFPEPVYSMAVIPKARGDEDKISSGLQKLAEEDLTFQYANNPEIHQLIISGMGDQHLDIIVSRLKSMGTAVDMAEPKVSYRETITKKIAAEGKHKKQSGGHGQYGHVKMEFEPCDSEDLIFEERIFGGSVPKNFHPAVEKGIREMMLEGIQAGYRVVGLKAILVDGSYHDVDSSEMSFKMAAHLAFKELINAGPVILEPVGHLEVRVPEDYMGDVMGDINKRRGRVIGMDPGKVIAEVPMAEMFKYAIELRSMTQGRGSFSFKFERYEQTPPPVAQKIIAQSKQ